MRKIMLMATLFAVVALFANISKAAEVGDKGKAAVNTKVTANLAESYKVGDSIKVLWKSTWYDASIVAAKKNKYKIHYDGYNESWDEWVGKDRMKKK